METTPKTSCPYCQQPIVVRDEMLGQTTPCPHCGQPITFAAPGEVQSGLSGREVYNVVTDVGAGVNVRLKDNLIQLAVIAGAVIVGALIGMVVVTEPRAAGAIVGGLIGMVAGLFGSGLFLMIYRFIRHVRGRHD